MTMVGNEAGETDCRLDHARPCRPCSGGGISPDIQKEPLQRFKHLKKR